MPTPGRRADAVGVDEEHVEGLPDGIGCTEIWEHLSERRAEEAEDR